MTAPITGWQKIGSGIRWMGWLPLFFGVLAIAMPWIAGHRKSGAHGRASGSERKPVQVVPGLSVRKDRVRLARVDCRAGRPGQNLTQVG